MSLEKRKISELPEGAVMLSEQEAFTYHYNILNKWKNTGDVFAFKYGVMFLGSAVMLTGAYLNNHFRRKLKLFDYGRIASYLPICVVPASLSFLIHHEAVIKELVLLKQEQCPICIELRSATIQSFFGVVLPLLLAPVSSMSLAHKYGTYNLPSLVQEPRQVLKLVSKLAYPIRNNIYGLLIGHALLGSAVTYLEAKSIYNVNLKLLELERTLEHSGRA